MTYLIFSEFAGKYFMNQIEGTPGAVETKSAELARRGYVVVVVVDSVLVAKYGWSKDWKPTRLQFDAWVVKNIEAIKAEAMAADIQGLPITTPGPRKPAPQVCPEVWNTKKVSADDAMAAVRAMCAGTK